MSNDTGRLLKEMNSLSSNMDVLLQELRESTKANIQSSDGIKGLVDDIKKSGLSGTGNESLEKTFKSITESFSKSILDQNNQLVSNLDSTIAKTLTGSVSDFLGNLPQQVAQVKSGQSPDFKSILGGDAIKNLTTSAAKSFASKIPGLKDGGTIEGDGMAVVGENGPEILNLKKGNEVRTMEQQMLDMMLEEGRQKNIKLGRVVDSKGPLENALSQITTDTSLIQEFREYAKRELDKSDLDEFLIDPDYLRDEFDYFMSERDRETFNLEDVQKLSQPVDNMVDKTTTVESQIKGDTLVSPQPVQKNPDTLAELQSPQKKPNTLAELQSPQKNLASVESKENISSIDKIKGNEMLAGGITSLTDKLKEKLEAAKAKQTNKQDSGSEVGEMVNTVTGLTEKASPVKPNVELLKQQALENAQKLKDSMSSTQKNTEEMPTKSTGKSDNKSSTGPKTASEISGSPFIGNDVKEMKSLLAAIYQALKSPLTVVNDVPFRPSSNSF